MTLEEKKREVRKMELEFNVNKLELRIMEMDEEKVKIQEAINLQKEKLKKGDY